MQRKVLVIIGLLVLAGLIGGMEVAAQGPAPGTLPPSSNSFTYQGQLKSAGTPYTGSCDFEFGLYNLPSSGSQIGSTQTAGAVPVTSGLFTSPIDFGAAAFDGSPRYLQIGVRCPAGGGGYTLLTSRQQLTPAPMAQYATTAGSLAGPNLYISGSGTLGGSLYLPITSSASVGVLSVGSSPILHSYGNGNTFLGANAGNFGLTGYYNTALGSNALRWNTAGYQNAAVGTLALNNNTLGNNNIAIGSSALFANTEGTGNIALGSYAGGVYSGSDSNNIAIGNNGATGESGTIRIGTGGTHTKTYIAGIYDVNSAGTAVYINSSGQLGIVSSSQRFKDNVRDMGPTSDILYQLRPVDFTYKPEYGGSPDQMQVGLIAEQVAAVAPWMVVTDEQGQPYTVRYEQLAPMLVNELQKQQGTIQTQASELTDLRSRLSAVESALASTDRGLAQNGLDGMSMPVWVLVGMVGLLVGQRAWRGVRP